MTETTTARELPSTMRAVRCDGAGGTEVLRVAEEPVPAPGAGEVLVRVAAAGINRADIMQRQGNYPPPPGESEVLGLEASGVVAAFGPGAEEQTALAVGDRVCALLAGGGCAEYVAVPVGQLMAVPEEMSLRDAAAFPEVACTVWTNLSERGAVSAGDVVLVHGASGGIGSFAVQYLAAIGARVFATAGGPEKCARAMQLGAEAAFDHRAAAEAGEPGGFAAWLKENTDGHGADVVLDVVGAPYLAPNVEALAQDGRIVVIAVQGGVKAESFNIMKLVAKRGWLTGSTLRARTRAEKAHVVAGTAKAALPLVADGRVALSVDAAFPLDEVVAAHEHFEATDRAGRVVLVVDPELAGSAEASGAGSAEASGARSTGAEAAAEPDGADA
jgi:NADPH:quinone reductase